MENATKALFIAAGVLIGIMTISFGLYLFTNLKGYVETMRSEINEDKIKSFNESFYKYINYSGNTGEEPDFELKIQDIVSIAHMAADNNKKLDIVGQESMPGYITVNIPRYSNLEKEINKPDRFRQIMNDYKDKVFLCSSNQIHIDEDSRKVNEISFSIKL